ncbi:T9SS type A sorting domain-containing protein [Chondrinema litorale]|uniref:T9SS type A sorting domain-containing protein n=1 Tax=Chondrinema litorale TaxID=2994555 RepID=UPI002543D066|nr:T9SS type A sorting domain-containing protein [Chondrinema litorale]UZR98696.1 T9SS type A sorting domain-containing protein [Chondrinema litorale]
MRNLTPFLLFILGFPFISFAQVTIVDESSSTNSEIVFSPSAATNRLLVVGVTSLSLLGEDVSAVDYGGRRLTKITDVTVSSTISSSLLYQNADLFYLDDYDISTRLHDTISITFDNDGINIQEKYISILLLDNADQYTPVSYELTNSSDNAKVIDTGTPISANVDDIIISISGHSSIIGSYSSTGGGTEIHELNGLLSSHSASYRSITSYDRYTPEFTKSGIGVVTTNMVIASVRINASFYESPGGISDDIELWLKADLGAQNGTSSASDGQDLDYWLDKAIARQNDGSSSQLSPPTFYDNSTDNINFNPIIDFDGETMGFDLADDYIFFTDSSKGVTIFAIAKADSTKSSKTRQYITDFGFAGNEGFGFTYGYDNVSGYTAISADGGAFENSHSFLTSSVILRYSIDFSTEAGIYINNNLITSTDKVVAMLSENEIRASSSHGEVKGPFTIGSQSKSGSISSNDYRMFDGKLGEIIVYADDLTSAQIQRIESYLAIKYGITLGSTSSTYNYLNSYGSTVWAGDATFQNDVAGIGRDDRSGLNQKQSKSTESDDILIIGLGSIASTNSANGNTFSNDISYLMWGNNNEGNFGYSESGTTVNGEDITIRLARVWKAQETGTLGTVHVQFNTSEIIGPDGNAGTNELADLRLLVDTDDTFANGATSVSPSTYDNSTDLIGFDHDFNASTGFYFTLGSVDFETAPLPVKLVHFSVELKDNKPYLTWTTTSESNNKQFEILRSTNGTSWQNIDVVKGAGNSNSSIHYSYSDTNLKTTSKIVYYMLKQVDFDGKSENSKVKSVSLDFFKKDILIYPNPADKVVNIELANSLLNSCEIHFYDITGKEVYQTSTSEKYIQIDTSNLKSGMYTIMFKGNSPEPILKYTNLVIR